MNTHDKNSDNGEEIKGNAVSSWVNGEPATRVSIGDRGLTYGDGVFETIRVENAPVLLSLHLDRLERGAATLSIPLDLPRLQREIDHFLAGRQQGILKVILTRGEGGRGYASPDSPDPTRILSWHEQTNYPPSYYQAGVNVFECTTTLAIGGCLAGIKHLNRLEQVLARQEWGASDYQEGIVCDTRGHVIEGVFSNIFMVKAGELHTPVLAGAGVAGVMREWLIRRCRDKGISVHESEITKASLFTMDEVFLSNSVFGVWPVKQCGQQSWKPGPIAMMCQREISSELLSYV